jgi:CTP:molybdopterin cytidylyltransferase MocA
MQAPVIILVLAAGASSRMRGTDKLLEPVAGEALLTRSARVAAATGCPVLVSLPPGRPDRAAALLGLPVTPLVVPDAAEGMSASLRAGVAAAQRAAGEGPAGLMVLPADMPAFTTAALAEVAAAFAAAPGLIWRGAAADGAAGHPAVFPRALWPELARVTGDRGGRDVLRAHAGRVATVSLPGRMALTDLDTPEDWAAWRASGGERHT